MADATPVYSADGLYAGRRVGDVMTWAEGTISHIRGSTVYGEHSPFAIAGLWWYRGNRGLYYQANQVDEGAR